VANKQLSCWPRKGVPNHFCTKIVVVAYVVVVVVVVVAVVVITKALSIHNRI